MDDFKWFLAFLVVVVAVWFGGRTAFNSPATSPATGKAPATEQSAPKAPAAPKGTAEQVKSAELEAKRLQEEIAKARAAENASAQVGRVSIVSLARAGTPQGEYVVIQASSANTAPVTITGLTVRSGVNGIGHAIPKAWILPYLNAQGEGEPAALRPGERAYIISGRSPLPIASGRLPNTASFQLNMCTGFFGRGTSFTPSLPLECPAPVEEPLPAPPNTLSDACYDYLASIPRCTVPGSVPVHLQGDSSCQAHAANKIGYTQCVNYHKNEPGFYRGEWRMYLGRDTLLWRSRNEIVELLDAQGRLIDSRRF